MVIEAGVRLLENAVNDSVKARITVFHCFNALNDISLDREDCEIQSIKLPCSSMIREVVLLRAFEAGADAVVVLTCPLGSCHYVQGNLRAAKRVDRVKKLLDEIGLDGRRLNIYHLPQGDQMAADRLITQTVSGLAQLGPAFKR